MCGRHCGLRAELFARPWLNIDWAERKVRRLGGPMRDPGDFTVRRSEEVECESILPHASRP